MLDLESNVIWLDNALNHFETGQFCDEVRCNFTIAHEIGHFILHKHLLLEDNLIAFHNELNPESKKIETQANMAGAMLLMTKELVVKKWNDDFKKINHPSDRIIKMTNFFRTSREAIQNRLDTLGLLKKF